MKELPDWMKVNVFPMLCYILAAMFFYFFLHTVGFPPSKPVDSSSWSYVALALFLFMLPEAKKLKLTQLFEYEAQVQEIKRDVREFKEETRNVLSAYTTMVSAVSNSVHQTFNLGTPSPAVVQQAKEELEALPSTAEASSTHSVVEFIEASNDDLQLALIKVRLEIEFELRRILGKPLVTALNLNRKIRYLSIDQMFNNFLIEYPDHSGLANSFSVVIKLANAAAHGHPLDGTQAFEAVKMGARIIELLKEIQPQG